MSKRRFFTPLHLFEPARFLPCQASLHMWPITIRAWQRVKSMMPTSGAYDSEVGRLKLTGLKKNVNMSLPCSVRWIYDLISHIRNAKEPTCLESCPWKLPRLIWGGKLFMKRINWGGQHVFLFSKRRTLIRQIAFLQCSTQNIWTYRYIAYAKF